ncbi:MULTISPECIES: hypothetical protein [unclassified Sphingopyxis]|uniref:hypothetical protein n=1 Tax=unclassified Sphingopyxis TaxID=2614943 RepID=UPI0025DCDA67|nr:MULTISPECIES: hypothetical protein [unclassified Sphingopyxis]
MLVADKAGNGDGKTLGATRILMSLAVFCLVSCSGAEPPNVEPREILPQPDQVAFFERPRTLAAARQSDQPGPLVVLLETDPWASVMGSDSPTFALYEDGTVIQKSTNGFVTTRLDKPEIDQLLDRLDLPSLSRSYGRFDAADATDQPEQNLLIYRTARPIFVSVYGSLEDKAVRAQVPLEVNHAYDVLAQFKHPKGREWLPENIEVMIWPYEHAPEPSLNWPEKWPGLNDAKTVRRGGDSFSIFMPSTKLADLRAFFERRNERGAFEIDGQKWSASIRFPFPHEKLWMAPRPELE